MMRRRAAWRVKCFELGARVHKDDAHLIAALRAGDEDAFVAFCQHVDRPLRGLVRRFVSGTAIDDVVQQTWMQALEALAQFEGRARLSTWVLQIGLNLARTQARRDGRETSLDGETSPDIDCFTTDGWWIAPPPVWPPSGLDPERMTADAEMLRHLETELQRLPETWRAAVVLCDVEGFEPRDAAAVLAVEEGNLRVLLHRGRSRLRLALGAHLRIPV